MVQGGWVCSLNFNIQLWKKDGKRVVVAFGDSPEPLCLVAIGSLGNTTPSSNTEYKSGRIGHQYCDLGRCLLKQNPESKVFLLLQQLAWLNVKQSEYFIYILCSHHSDFVLDGLCGYLSYAQGLVGQFISLSSASCW